jgi:hypothetical protein
VSLGAATAAAGGGTGGTARNAWASWYCLLIAAAAAARWSTRSGARVTLLRGLTTKFEKVTWSARTGGMAGGISDGVLGPATGISMTEGVGDGGGAAKTFGLGGALLGSF